MDREEWLKRFLDVEGTKEFSFKLEGKPWQDIYVERMGRDVEIGFISTCRGEGVPGPGIRYHVQSSGQWELVSTSDLGDWWHR
ncbi:hypothetical protein BDZ94DRAFT_1246025 [Collybia nuda]|uniref:Uncharacterized protein n=1 Tax=Collybia nuda TaxID=64659 RepID=A0A9P5YIY2_9AGAR|nr:hypothetical protein BDZ94DRAFT_1246025 [Collybia nuda]